MINIKLEMHDDYINEMAEYFEKQGKQLQRMINAYIAIMERVTDEGIAKGETSGALSDFLAYAEKLKQVVASTSEEVRDSVMNYMEEVDTQDQYLY
mgnify:CR=1 FL=1